MDPKTILTANFLDILFEGMNKEYGAYELRKSYNKRIVFSLIITLLIIAILFISSTIAKHKPVITFIIPESRTVDLDPPAIPKLPTHPAFPSPPPHHIATTAYTHPLITKDNRVIQPPAAIEQLLHTAIDVKTAGGTDDNLSIVAPEIPVGTTVVATIPKKENEDTVFIGVEIEAKFPGGPTAWSKYVGNAIERNIDEFGDLDYGTCQVKFIVDKEGKVSHVEAITMKGSKLAEMATNAIRKGPDWIPAQQNGTYVNAYRVQPVTLSRAAY
jgi:protein TonB